jgi:hypothetical protein
MFTNIKFNMGSSIDFYKKHRPDKVPLPLSQQRRRETFAADDSSDDDTTDIIKANYINALRARAKAVTEYCLQSPQFSPWKKHWEFLADNLFKKNKLTFKLLDESDSDIAYVINKGSEINFQVRDKTRYAPLNIYQYVLYHEMAHMSTHTMQHTPEFHKMLNLLSLAAYELGFIDLRRIPHTTFYKMNSAPVTSAESLQDEIILGCNEMLEAHKANPKLMVMYTDLRKHVAERV